VVGVKAPLYEGTKHSGATAMMERSGNERAVQAILGHADVRSTRRYVELSDQAKVEVLLGPGRFVTAAII
jgi:site-specific recombinase XerC